MLTRYLYAKDEVEASLITSLLEKEDVCECYFWTYELFYSGFDIKDILWRIYYDFYFECNPQLEPYIYKKFSVWEERKEDSIFAFIVRNLFRSKVSSKVFVLRQMMTSGQTNSCLPPLISADIGRPYKGRKPLWCKNHDSSYHHWLIAISKVDYINIAYHTYVMVETKNLDTLFDELAKYFANFYDVKKDVREYWQTRDYKDDVHYLLSIIVHLCDYGNSVSSSVLMVAPREEHLIWIRSICYENIVMNHKPYQVLSVARHYRTREDIGSFVLARENFNDLRSIYARWEDYALSLIHI